MTPARLGVELAVSCENTLGESPIFDRRTDRLWWVDIRGPRLCRWSFDDGRLTTWDAPDLCCAVALGRDGPVVALGRRLVDFDEASGAFIPVVSFPDEPAANRLNEMRIGPDGTLWVGSMVDFAKSVGGRLYRLAPGRPLDVRRRDVGVPNSLGWSPAGDRMYFADTLDGRILSFGFDRANGALSDEQVLVNRDLAGAPDGCAVDSDGGLWSARIGGGQVVRVTPSGQPTHVVGLPAGIEPTACAFRGGDLFITTRRQGMSPEQLAEAPHAGALFVARTSFQGLEEPVLDWPLSSAAPTAGAANPGVAS